MTDTETSPYPRTRVDELIDASHELGRRVDNVITIITNIARKSRPEHLPAGFEPLTHSHRRTVHYIYARRHVQVRFDPGSNLEFPMDLLSAPDRVVATWARSRVKACRINSYHRARRKLTSEIERDEALVKRATRSLEENRRRLANLSAPPKTRPRAAAGEPSA